MNEGERSWRVKVRGLKIKMRGWMVNLREKRVNVSGWTGKMKIGGWT